MPKILITAERLRLADLLEKGLRRQNWTTEIAMDRCDTIERVRDGEIDCLILDFDLFGEDSVNLFDELHDDKHSIPTVIITKCPEMSNRTSSQRRPTNPILIKPFYLRELIEQVETCLKISH